ncbi:MAG: hypothetical protein FWE11_02755 [Defluviitaleaceae bacterium]|nr:hypothetical protein [Defluviitaleaceae bacterium]
MKNKKASKGFTLLEATIALAVWMILSVSIFLVWRHSANATTSTLTRQSAFENARISMDAIIMNIQMAQAILLEVEDDYILQRLVLTERNPQGHLHDYTFRFNAKSRPGSSDFNILIFGLTAANELASGIALVRIQPIDNSHIQITIVTDCEHPVTLEGSVDIRYKSLTVIRR